MLARGIFQALIGATHRSLLGRLKAEGGRMIFHALIDVAPLKPFSLPPSSFRLSDLPRPHRRGPMEGLRRLNDSAVVHAAIELGSHC
jgi:hypothetical protein